MATEHENTSAEDQALADEWAAALEETGDVGQDDIDALLAADAATAPAGNDATCDRSGDEALRRSTSTSGGLSMV